MPPFRVGCYLHYCAFDVIIVVSLSCTRMLLLLLFLLDYCIVWLLLLLLLLLFYCCYYYYYQIELLVQVRSLGFLIVAADASGGLLSFTVSTVGAVSWYCLRP